MDSLKKFNKAYYYGVDVMDLEWKTEVTSHCNFLWESLQSRIQKMEIPEKIKILEKFEELLHDEIHDLKYNINLLLCQIYFNQSVVELD